MKIIYAVLAFIFLWSGSVGAADFYTVATAREQVRNLLSERSNGYFTDTEIDNWVKEAVEDVSTRTECVQVSDTIALVTGQYEYATTVGSVSVVDIINVSGMVYVVSTDITGNTLQDYIGLRRISTEEIASLPMIESGPPRYFYHYADKIGILPVPTATENAQVVRAYFSKQSQTIGDLPNQYQSLTFWYAAAMAYKKQGKVDDANKMMELYLQKISQIMGYKESPKKVQ